MTARPSQLEPPLTEHERRRLKLLPWVFVAVMSAPLIIGGAIGLTIGVRQRRLHPDNHAHLLLTVVVAVGPIIVVMLVGWLLIRYLFRHPSYQQVNRYSWNRRRRVTKALRKGSPISDADLPVAAAVIALIQKQRWALYLYPVLGVIALVNAALTRGLSRIDQAVLGLLFLALSPYVSWTRQRLLRNWAAIEPASAQSGTPMGPVP